MLLAAAVLAGCNRQGSDADPVVVPEKLDPQLVSMLACPENLTPVRLARRSELDQANARIGAGKLKRWDGTPVKAPVGALLIREDGRIGYEVREGVPVMLIDQALVLDEAVGAPDPEKHRSRKAPG